MRRFLFVLGLLAAASGCGQKGPLYYRDNPPPGIKPTRTDVYKPVPYPKDARPDDSADEPADGASRR
ncbi:MAG: lipoprotein [Betaproteobacteria bacterium]|nr:lipoprotein [Betaproteobacteria bacterium]